MRLLTNESTLTHAVWEWLAAATLVCGILLRGCG